MIKSSGNITLHKILKHEKLIIRIPKGMESKGKIIILLRNQWLPEKNVKVCKYFHTTRNESDLKQSFEAKAHIST